MDGIEFLSLLKDSIARLSWLDLSNLEVKTWFMTFLKWFHLVLLSQNIKNLVSLAIHTAFSAAFLGFVIHALVGTNLRRHNRVADSQRIVVTRGNLLIVQIITIILSITQSTAVFHCWVAYHGIQRHSSFTHMVYFCFQAVTWSLSLLLISFEKRSASSSYHFLLRGWWVSSFILWVYETLSYAIWLVSDSSHSFHITFDDCVLLATLPLISTLLVIAIQGSTRVAVIENSDILSKNLLNDKISCPQNHNSGILTGYASSGFISRLTFFWLNSLLTTAQNNALNVQDIPMLRPQDRAESVSVLLQSKLQSKQCSLVLALFQSFWKQFSSTAILALAKSSVMYMGPLLIQSFIDITTDKEVLWYKGMVLAFILFLAKFSEVIIDHQYKFLCGKLSLSLQSSLICMIYQKGLCLSNSARKSHGMGKIVNYMSVDVNTMSRMVQSVHDLWSMPIQISIALVILFGMIRFAVLAGLATMVIVMVMTLFLASEQQKCMSQVLSSKDNRMKVTNEALSNMKIIKLQAWQEWFHRKVDAARAKEYIWIMRVMYITAISVFLLWLSPLAVSVISFGSCVLMRIELTPGCVFTAIATFRILQEPLRDFPGLITRAAQTVVSLHRVEKYLHSDEVNAEAVENISEGAEYALSIIDGSFKWSPEDEELILNNISLCVKSSSFTAIVGTVGSGKSALLSCILGEMEKVTGTVEVGGSIAYVAQSSWIQNGTIQDNILFGKEIDHVRYKNTLRVCALENDLSQMRYGDKTEIGERGINLSGGQKQRIQLARAYYQNSDIYLLDDIFSALDAHTGSYLFKECIRGVLKNKTVVLVTHQVEFLREADMIVVMRQGQIMSFGTYNELSQQGSGFGAFVDAHKKGLDDIRAQCDMDYDTARDDWISQSSCSISADASSPANPFLKKHVSVNALYDQRSETFNEETHEQTRVENELVETNCASNLIEEEERAIGRVTMPIYWAYWTKSFRGLHIVVLFFIQTCWQALQILSDFWLAFFTSGGTSIKPVRFISVYSYLAIGSGFFVFMRSLLVAISGLRTAQEFYHSMLDSIFRAPMSFFDTTPTGRILTRSSTDQQTLDFRLPLQYGSLLADMFQLIGVLFVTCKVTWQMLFVIIPLGWVYVEYLKYFLNTSRELTRLDSIAMAPIIHNFSETLSGVTTIRAFHHQERFISTNARLVNTYISISFHNIAANEWFGFRIESIGTMILCSSALLLVLLPKGVIQPEFVGLSLSYGLALNGCLFFLVQSICAIEQSMVAVERILQYCKIPSEAPLILQNKHPGKGWPIEGSISVEHLQLRYLPKAPLVLKDVTFSVNGGEKLGVVGRTGSGKSSLVLALFRIVEPAAGKIIIDGIDISILGLNDLRSTLNIISQEPTLFEGTVRDNLDPLHLHTDQEIWESLEKCLLADVISRQEEKLDTLVAEKGENWSMGQKQLICLGRVLLRRRQILILDEATASVDTHTDLVLQNTIKTEFADCTVISIAHRISSIISCDKVLVLDAGKAMEFGSPTYLLEQPSSLFKSLVTEYWSRSKGPKNGDT